MEKEDILAESRKENQGKDPQEKHVVDHGTAIGSVVFICFISVIYCLAAKTGNWTMGMGIYGAYTAYEAIIFAYKYYKLKQTHELLLSVFFGICAIILLVFFFVGLYR
jgi:Ca2+/Na+ antiporter